MEKYILKNKYGSITIYRDNDKVYLSLSLNPTNSKNNTFRYDGKYIDDVANKSYFVNVKISTNDLKQANIIKESGVNNIKTNSRIVKETSSSNIIKFVGYKNNIRVEVKLPMKSLTHKCVDNTPYTKRIGYINHHDKHGNCGVTHIVSGGLVNPK